MTDAVFNFALGRVAELYNNVDNNLPTANSALLAVIIARGAATDEQILDARTLQAVFDTAANEMTGSGYARKTLTDALNWDGTGGGTTALTSCVDDANNWMALPMPNITWTSVAGGGSAWTDLIIAYDSDTTGGTDTNILPLTLHGFAVTPDGSDIVGQIAAGGFYRASRV